MFTPRVACKAIAIASKRNTCLHHPWEDHHVDDPCQSVEDEACDDQVFVYSSTLSISAVSLPPSLFFFRFLQFFSRRL